MIIVMIHWKIVPDRVSNLLSASLVVILTEEQTRLQISGWLGYAKDNLSMRIDDSQITQIAHQK